MDKTTQIAEEYSCIQEKMCEILEQADGKGKFSRDKWSKDIGGGITRVMENGNIIEKAAINFSHVSGPFSPAMKGILKEDANNYSATGISSILHAGNPFVPTIHMNVRYFALDNGVHWFGGGIDLTPMYIDKAEAAWFHGKLKAVCDKYSANYYPDYKEWADNYFFLPHRDETRGVGGIFFDRLKPESEDSFESLFNFTKELANTYPVIYAEIMKNKANNKYSAQNKEWQLIRRGRYAEFNLVYDRGTKFGLESGGNAESILVSLPKDVKWHYNYPIEAGSAEEQTQMLLKKGIDWVNM